MSDLTVEASRLTRLYGGRAVVEDVTFQVQRGEVLGFLGPNGAGKSTTMKMLTGNLAPSAGSVKICGIDIVNQPKEAKALIGYLPEVRPLYKELTVDEYLTFSARLHRVTNRQIKRTVEETKMRCGLEYVGRRLIENLSNGYQQRVAIAQAIIHNPMVVILDEPTVGLDPMQIRDIRALIREIGQQHSVVLSTHILPEVEIVCDHVQIIHQGKLVFNGGIEALKQLHKGNHLLLGLRAPPTIDQILAIEGVKTVDVLNNGLWRVVVSDAIHTAETIVCIATSQNWGLYQIAPEATSLENVFLQLTHA